jgi:Zn-dependent M28 family amino/carboxypeptidase
MKLTALVVATLLLALGAGVVYCTAMPGTSHAGPLPRLSGSERDVSAELRRHVQALAVEIGARRATEGDSLARAERYLVRELSTMGAGKLRRETVAASPAEAANLVLDLPGEEPAPLVLVGAHYDSAPGGTPGANDNGSGTAAALVLARRLANSKHRLPLRVVFFANEEMPYFGTSAMGSVVHARGCAARGERLRAMFSLETMGHFSDAPGSQKYPPPLSSLYPDTGNFIGFVGDLASRALVRESLGRFRAHATVPSEGAALPASLPGVGWSDHWAFWQQGYAAVMVTDTAPFRDPNYHLPSDTPEHLDFDRLARVVLGLEVMLKELTAG